MAKIFHRRTREMVNYTVSDDNTVIKPDCFHPYMAYTMDSSALTRPMPPEPPAPKTFLQRLRSRLRRADLYLPKINALSRSPYPNAPLLLTHQSPSSQERS